MSLKTILRLCTTSVPRTFQIRNVSGKKTHAGDLTKLDDLKDIGPVDTEPVFTVIAPEEEEIIEMKRNKSRLSAEHRNILNGQRPYNESMIWYHDTVKYKKRMLGRYGLDAAGVPAGVAWPTIEEVEDAKTYERVLYPRSVTEEWEIINKNNKKKAAEIQKREAELISNMSKMQTWIEEVNNRVQKKEKVIKAATERKQQMIEKIRRQVGYNISHSDPKLKEMLGKMEEEDKKKLKESNKMKKQEKLLQTLQNIHEKLTSNATDTKNKKQQADAEDD